MSFTTRWYKLMALLTIAMLVLAACGSETPASTAVPPTAATGSRYTSEVEGDRTRRPSLRMASRFAPLATSVTSNPAPWTSI